MTAPAPDVHPLEPSLRRAHRAVLAWLAACAVFAALQWTAGEAMPGPEWTTPAVVLAVATVLTRRLGTSPVLSSGGRAFWTFTAYGLAAVLGALAAWTAHHADAPRVALVFVVGAALFCLPPPPKLSARAP